MFSSYNFIPIKELVYNVWIYLKYKKYVCEFIQQQTQTNIDFTYLELPSLQWLNSHDDDDLLLFCCIDQSLISCWEKSIKLH